MRIESKIAEVSTTIFETMSRMATDHGAINLSQGYPDFNVPGPLLDSLEKYSRAGYNQYPPMAGIKCLREEIGKKIGLLYGGKLDPESEITVTSGATEAIFVVVQSVIHTGDETVVFDPAYDSYDPSVRLAGGKTIHVPLAYPGFHIDFERLTKAISSRTKLIILNSPHNPSGSVVPASDLDRLAETIRETKILLLADEVHEHMVYDGVAFQSVSGHEELKRRSFVVSSFGKTYHATGWKVGYCGAPAPLSSEFRKIHQFVNFTTHTPTQWAIAEYMEQHPEHYQELPRFYQAKRDLFVREMAETRFVLEPAAGTYFQLADYRELSNMPDVDFAEYLTRHVGVASIPISAFYESPPDRHIVRFCFAKEDVTLRAAATKLVTMDIPS